MTDVVIASGDNAHLVDALSAGPLATLRGAPVLLTQERALPAATAAEVKRLGATRAYLIGTVDVIGTVVETALRAAGVTTIVRLGGADRYATAVAVSQEISPPGRALAMLVEEAGMVRDIQINVGKGRKKNAQVTDVVLPTTADVPTPVKTSGNIDLTHGVEVTTSNTGRAGAATAGISGYSGTLTLVSGNVTYSTTQTIRNTRFTGQVTVHGGTVTFEFCSFEYQPPSASRQLYLYNGGAATGNVVCNWCDFDTGLRGAQGNFETCNFQAGERGGANPPTTGNTFTMYRCRFQGCGNNVGVHQWRSGATSTLTECYLGESTTGASTHADAIEIYSSDYVTLLRCRVVNATSSLNQACVNIAVGDPSWANGGMPPAGNPVVVDSCYINGGISPVTRGVDLTNPLRNTRFVNNKFGDSSYWGRECDLNNVDITNDLAYQMNVDDTVVYWATSNVWDTSATSPATAPSGDATAGLPHTPGTYVDERNFYGGSTWIWNGSVVGSGSATVPGIPTNVAATAGNANATVSWTDPSDGGSVITGYTVTPYVGATAQTSSTYTVAQTTLNGSTRSVVKGNLANGTTYTFKVAATNAVGTGSPSASSNAVTPTGTIVVPGIPTIGLASVLGATSVSVAFTPGSTGGEAPTYQALSTPGSLTGTSSQSPVTVSGLTTGTPYTFKVQATNSAGPSGWSASSNSVTPAASAFPTPQTTGPAAGGYTNLTTYTGSLSPVSGTLIEGKIINGYLDLTNNNITVRGCRVLGAAHLYGSGITFEYCEFSGGTYYGLLLHAHSQPDGRGGTIRYCYFYQVGEDDPLQLTIGPYIVEHNYITYAGSPPAGTHMDMLPTWDGPCTGMRIHHNSFVYHGGGDWTTGTVSLTHYNNSGISYNDVQITDNYFESNTARTLDAMGGNTGGGTSNLVVTGNVFNSTWTNTVAVGDSTGNVVWGSRGNVWDNNRWNTTTGTIIPAPW